MKHKSFDHLNCSLAQTLTVIGERWTLLILREAFFGTRRFNRFERNLGVSKNILTSRLNRLVNEGILYRRPARDSAHPEYVLTDKGLELQPILLSMTHWGDKHRPHPKGQRLVFVERSTGQPIRRMSAVSQDGRQLNAREIKAVAGPGMASTDG